MPRRPRAGPTRSGSTSDAHRCAARVSRSPRWRRRSWSSCIDGCSGSCAHRAGRRPLTRSPRTARRPRPRRSPRGRAPGLMTRRSISPGRPRRRSIPGPTGSTSSRASSRTSKPRAPRCTSSCSAGGRARWACGWPPCWSGSWPRVSRSGSSSTGSAPGPTCRRARCSRGSPRRARRSSSTTSCRPSESASSPPAGRSGAWTSSDAPTIASSTSSTAPSPGPAAPASRTTSTTAASTT